MFGMLVFFINLSHVEFQVRYLVLVLLVSVIDGFEWFSMGNLHKKNPVNTGVPQGFILGPTFFPLYINDLLDDVICDTAIYEDDTTFC